MTIVRECFVLPALFLTVAWLGGFRMAEDVRLVPPPLMSLALAMLLITCLARAGVLVPERLMNGRRAALENLSGFVVLLSLFAACAQVFNLVTPESGLFNLLFTVFFLVQLMTTLAAVGDRVLLLRGLTVLFGSAFLIRFVALEALYSSDGGTLQRVLTVLLEGVTLGALGYEPNAPVTGYVALLALVLFIAGLILLPQGEDGLTTRQPQWHDDLEISGSDVRGELRDSTKRTTIRVRGMGPRVVALLSAAAILAACSVTRSRPHEAAAVESGSRVMEVDDAVRDAALASARVWREPEVPVGQANLGANPAGGWSPDDLVSCRFVARGTSGTTPKFDCQLPDGEIVKIKYGKANEELYSEVAATRLLAALGFGADQVFVVRGVRCFGCPRYPFMALRCFDRTGARWPCFTGAFEYETARDFEHVIVERRMAGRAIEARENEGWAWFELDRIDPARGGASRAEVDALRLMAVFFAHWDNKAANQRLVCRPGTERSDGSCARPFAIIQDLGAAFGPRKVDLPNWRRVPVWADARDCRVSMKRLPWGGGTYPDREISDGGRRLLLELLEQLSREQVEGLFTASRIVAYDAPSWESRSAKAWAAAFSDKVRQIREAGPCPTSNLPTPRVLGFSPPS